MNILKLFVSRASLAGAATVLLPMAVAAQKSAPAQDVAPEFAKLLAFVLIAVGYCSLALAVGCGSRNDPFCFDMARLGFILTTSGFCIMLFSS